MKEIIEACNSAINEVNFSNSQAYTLQNEFLTVVDYSGVKVNCEPAKNETQAKSIAKFWAKKISKRYSFKFNIIVPLIEQENLVFSTSTLI